MEYDSAATTNELQLPVTICLNLSNILSGKKQIPEDYIYPDILFIELKMTRIKTYCFGIHGDEIK